MRDRVQAFADTNVLVYLFSENEPIKRRYSVQALNDYKCNVSTQVLNEFCNVCTKKWHFSASAIGRALDKICAYAVLWPVDLNVVKQAVFLHAKYRYAYYDCLMISSALICGCEILLTEDLTDGQTIEERLTVKNIYRP
ncbi:MAG: PIN domain-containing protein [Synergistaceae bacterium]|jgi:predicted nucleic acid-binding protein|nr:PIN domain-containing protein [Synergistaceae bacterium]